MLHQYDVALILHGTQTLRGTNFSGDDVALILRGTDLTYCKFTW